MPVRWLIAVNLRVFECQLLAGPRRVAEVEILMVKSNANARAIAADPVAFKWISCPITSRARNASWGFVRERQQCKSW